MGVPFLKFSILSVVGAAVLVAVAGCNRSGGGGASVALVGKDAISQQEFYDYLQRKPSFTGVVNATQVGQRTVPVGAVATVQIPDSPGFQAMKDLIINQVVLQLAKEENVYPSDGDVNKELESQRQQNPKLIEGALSKGISLDELKNEFRNELAKFNLQTKDVKETTQMATDYMKANPKQFIDPPQVQAQMVIVTPSDTVKGLAAMQADVKAKKAEVEHALDSGQPFATVAKQYTTDKRLISGLEAMSFHYGITDETKMPPNVRKVFDATAELKTSDWQPLDKNGLAFVKYYIEKKVAAKPTPQTPEIVERVRRALALQQGAKNGINLDRMVATRIEAIKDQIKITPKQYEQPWKDFVSKMSDQLAQTPVVGATAPTGATPPAATTTPAPPAAAKK